MGDWEKAEQRVTSAFFIVWAVGVVLLGVWHLANQFSESVVYFQVAVAFLAAASAIVCINRRKMSEDLHAATGFQPKGCSIV
jgi:uncharacterized membrane protein YiaA